MDVLNEFWRAYLYQSNGQLSGLAMTLWLLVISVVIGFFLSIFMAIGRVSGKAWLSRPIGAFTYFFRGTPLYVQILLIYTAMYKLAIVKSVPALEAFFMSGFNCMILALTLNTVGYTTEIFAGAIRSMPPGEVESARAYGMSGWTLYRRVILPQALRRVLPAYSNEVVLMLHATSLAFTATVPDLLKIARDANAATYQTFTSYGIAALIYLCVSFILVGAFRIVEKRQMAFLNH
ncbi:histidine ABC transporter permease HisM [Alcaligenes faecalis]|jgi:histidine transport system permease protein|uniref:Histidine/lysine/arginine/ornithine transport system permease protein HisM n=1 Tax=Alcaligenes faecalis TaxID=511 RepID=A0A0M7CAW7_ALCFA|nr:histidine ABC transporter permease HisM [Alcaligenes faecalis]ALO37712.1 amino acid ABC transporter permease [Alcaligenes faecalis]ARP52969.1 amino acid ABC transporter permease [Alcaligenes faecalis]ATH98970.1 histidine ABC transporter permease HisM [Alcaligenes faecalis]AYZ91756.1 histidine ABC transporter permease HisM [Alcaligenes faecalis]KAA1286475.1 histidine ABC transporter permease HisM [Alcaligenes faecalis]